MDTIVATSLAVTFSVGSFDVSWQLQNVVVFVIYSGEIQMHFRIIWEIESKYNMCYSFLNSWAAFCIVTISNFYICYSTIPRMRSNNFSAVASVFSSKKHSTKYFFPIQHVTGLLTAFKIQKCNICNSKIKCLKFFRKVSLWKMSIIERNGVVPKTISQYESSLAEYPKMHLKISWMYY